MQSILGTKLLRQIPEHLVAAVQSGDMQVYGSIIRSVTTGRITGHLQETSGLASLVSQVPAAPLDAANIGIDLIGHTASYIQGEQIKAAIGHLQHLGLAMSALTVVGIGVSVAGFVILSAKIDRVEAKVEAMADRLDRLAHGVDALHRARIVDDLTRLRTAAQQMEEAWHLGEPVSQWRLVAQDCHSLANSFERHATEMLANPIDTGLEVEPMLEALALAVATRTSARLAAGDEMVARQAASEGAETLIKLGASIRPAEIALHRVRTSGVEPASPEWKETLERASDEMRPRMAAIRSRERAAAATTATLVELEHQNISGRAWLEAARSEHETPLLCLLPTDRE